MTRENCQGAPWWRAGATGDGRSGRRGDGAVAFLVVTKSGRRRNVRVVFTDKPVRLDQICRRVVTAAEQAGSHGGRQYEAGRAAALACREAGGERFNAWFWRPWQHRARVAYWDIALAKGTPWSNTNESTFDDGWQSVRLVENHGAWTLRP